MSNISFISKIVAIWSCLLLTGCPAQFNVVVRNDADVSIAILSAYSDATLSVINPGETKTVIYNFDCFKVRAGNQLYEFSPVMPTDEYVAYGTFSSSFNAVFTSSGEFRIFIDNNEVQNNFLLKPGCKQ